MAIVKGLISSNEQCSSAFGIKYRSDPTYDLVGPEVDCSFKGDTNVVVIRWNKQLVGILKLTLGYSISPNNKCSTVPLKCRARLRCWTNEVSDRKAARLYNLVT